MKVEGLTRYDIPKEFIQKFREENIKRLFPPQIQAINKGLFGKENLLLSCPTASGKTLIATLSIIKTLAARQGKVLYLVPLVALAQEKYAYYKNLFSARKVALSCGDLDSTDPWLLNYDLIIATTEKFDSLIRHRINWLRSIRLIIADEIHLMNDPSRGPTLEILLTQLRIALPAAKVLALSATISNAEELTSWLGARLVLSEFRPVKLYEGIACNSRIFFPQKEGYSLTEDLDAEASIVDDTLNRFKKQLLFFVSTRRSSESLAERLSGLVNTHLTKQEKKKTEEASTEALSALETPTRQCRRLASCIERGTAFHHAGLVSKQKALVEEAFRSGTIKVVVATPTLAMGVNLPAFRVVIRDIRRYYPGRGSTPIPVLEYKQFIGRAGRPQYDKFGESLLIARTFREREKLRQRYIEGRPENIESKLASQSALRMHILSLVACDFASCLDELFRFLQRTFFGFQYQDVHLLEEKLNAILEELKRWKFIVQRKEGWKATTLGNRVSQLYIDPYSAHYFIGALHRMRKEDYADFAILQVISDCSEMAPALPVRESELEGLLEVISEREEFFLTPVPHYWDEEYEGFLHSVKLALVFESWMKEKTEEEILEEFNTRPGELQGKLRVADWLLYCLHQLSLILKIKTVIKDLKILRLRLHYGVTQELLPLVCLKEIGRKRSRKLFQAGIRSTKDIRKVPVNVLSSLIGPKVASFIKSQVKINRASRN